MIHSFIAVPLILCVSVGVHARPSRTVPYFPHYNPWNIDDIGIHAEESRWNPYEFADESMQKMSKYSYSLDPSDKKFSDTPPIKDNLQISVPVYEKGKGGFVPPSMSALDKVYWWDKRFNNFDIPPSEDLPYFSNDIDYETNAQGAVKKRDYTAVQLVNMLKALAKSRRQRQIRIAGKGLRFGISR